MTFRTVRTWHRAFPFLFNGIYYAGAQSVPLAGAGQSTK